MPKYIIKICRYLSPNHHISTIIIVARNRLSCHKNHLDLSVIKSVVMNSWCFYCRTAPHTTRLSIFRCFMVIYPIVRSHAIKKHRKISFHLNHLQIFAIQNHVYSKLGAVASMCVLILNFTNLPIVILFFHQFLLDTTGVPVDQLDSFWPNLAMRTKWKM